MVRNICLDHQSVCLSVCLSFPTWIANTKASWIRATNKAMHTTLLLCYRISAPIFRTGCGLVRKICANLINMDNAKIDRKNKQQTIISPNYTKKMKTMASTNHCSLWWSRTYQKSARNGTRNRLAPESGRPTRKIWYQICMAQSRSRRRKSVPKVGAEIWTVCHQL